MNSNLLSIAPMIDWSNTHFRVLMRLLAPNALLYTEMQTAGAIQHKPERALQFHAMEHPLAIQLGGSDPNALAKCALLAEKNGFDEINLNLGCPSDKVQAGRFGACLMTEPLLVSECIRAMKNTVKIPVTAKVRIGIDNQDSYAFFSDFVHQLMNAGCDKLIVHARKAWLNGLNPKQNRTIPPVNYPFVYRIKQEFKHIPVIINGNILEIEEIKKHTEHVDGVMIGRLACNNPYAIATIHHALYPESTLLTRQAVLSTYLNYALVEQEKNIPISILIKPILNFAHGLPGASGWKQYLMRVLQNKHQLYTVKDVFPL